jgi:hypothetical protein
MAADMRRNGRLAYIAPPCAPVPVEHTRLVATVPYRAARHATQTGALRDRH